MKGGAVTKGDEEQVERQKAVIEQLIFVPPLKRGHLHVQVSFSARKSHSIGKAELMIDKSLPKDSF